MLALLTRVAKKLFPYRWFSYVLLGFFVILIITQLLFAPLPHQLGNNYLALSFLSCLWLILNHLLIITFNDIPLMSCENKSWFVRFKLKIRRVGYYVLSLFFISLTLAIVFLSLRLFRAL